MTTAMIGTDKKQVDTGILPPDFDDAVAMINSNEAIDKEQKFLQLASLAFNVRQSGFTTLQKEVVTTLAPAEEKPYCSSEAQQVLKDILNEESIPLLKFWLQYCEIKQQIVQPELIPSLLELGISQKNLQRLIASCCGKRGEWLSRFNDAWNFSAAQSPGEMWLTGTAEQRRVVLTETRKTNPGLAREWMQQTWSQEDAGTKVIFLEILSYNVSEQDIPFLESLTSEKGKKVREEALRRLKEIAGSAIVRQYEAVLQQTVQLNKGKALLGMINKKGLRFSLPPFPDENIFKTGIEKLSSNKAISDEEHIISQLIQSVPPAFWEKQLDSSPQDIIDLFQKDDTGKKLMPALALATIRFSDRAWASHLVQCADTFYIDLIPLLKTAEQEAYSNKFFGTYPDDIIRYACEREDEWGFALTKNIFRHTAKNLYQYNRSFYSQHIHLIPVQVVAELEKMTPPEPQLHSTWSNTSDYIIKLITLKIQTIKAFTA